MLDEITARREAAIASGWEASRAFDDGWQAALAWAATQQEPVAWADDAAMAGGVGNCASAAAKRYWEGSHQIDQWSALRLSHPLYAAPAPDRLREAFDLLDEMFTAYEDGVNCYEREDDYSPGCFIGKSVLLPEETEQAIAELLNDTRPKDAALAKGE